MLKSFYFPLFIYLLGCIVLFMLDTWVPNKISISFLKIHFDIFKEENYEIFGKGVSTLVGSLNFEPFNIT